MPSSDPRRKRIRVDQEVYAQPGTVALLTACTASKAPIFRETDNAEIVLSEIGGLHGDRWSVVGYCIMPDHVHLLVLNVDGSLIDFMRILKGRTARRLRGQIDGVLWQRSFHDHLIRRNNDISATLRYLFENPVRSGLASNWTDYRWCGSLRWPEIGPDFFAAHPSDMMWAEMFAIDDG